MDPAAVGEALKRLLSARKMSQQALARKAVLTPAYVSFLVAGKRLPSMAALGRLAPALGVPLWAMLVLVSRHDDKIGEPWKALLGRVAGQVWEVAMSDGRFEEAVPEKRACLCCSKELELRATGPAGGTLWTTHGNYGSRLFDSASSDFLEAVVCDECLERGKAGVKRAVHKKPRKPPETVYLDNLGF